MFKTNEYFNGKVMSIAFETGNKSATIGAMAKGEYEFGTSTKEEMKVTSGEMDVMLPGASEWKTYKPNDTFFLEKDVKFKVRIKTDTTYLCIYSSTLY